MVEVELPREWLHLRVRRPAQRNGNTKINEHERKVTPAQKREVATERRQDIFFVLFDLLSYYALRRALLYLSVFAPSQSMLFLRRWLSSLFLFCSLAPANTVPRHLACTQLRSGLHVSSYQRTCVGSRLLATFNPSSIAERP